MKDVHNYVDKRGIGVTESGITNLRLLFHLRSGIGKQTIIANTEMSVSLPPKRKGVHMSRFVEVSQTIRGSVLSNNFLESTVKKIKNNLGSSYAKIKLSFTCFLTKKTPVSELECQTDYFCEVICEINEKEITHCLKVEIPITTLCPCSKEIGVTGAAHNQRAKIILTVLSKEFTGIENFIKTIEKGVCGEIYSLLKRPDEKFVIDRIYKNPMFAEDVVRQTALSLKRDKRIFDYEIVCKSYESIHNHNVFAVVRGGKNIRICNKHYRK